MTKDNLDKCKAVALDLLHLPVEPCEKVEFLVYHPFFTDRYTMDDKHNLVDILNDKTAEAAVKKRLEKRIKNAEKWTDIIMLMHKPYWGFYFAIISPLIADKKEYGEWLISIWTMTEFPNADNNFIAEWCKMFKKAEKRYLMDKEEQEIYNSLPDKVILYRGVHDKKSVRKLSYTTDYDIAKWFAQRFTQDGDKSYIIKTVVPKSAIFAYIDNEKECIINPRAIKEYTIEEIIKRGNGNAFPNKE